MTRLVSSLCSLASLLVLQVISMELRALQRFPRLANGFDADLGEFPYQVSIRSSEYKIHHCGGVIINECFVLTAAHCLHGFESEELEVHAGTQNLKNIGEIHEISNIILPDSYSFDDFYELDIGLIKVKNLFDSNKGVVGFAKLVSDGEVLEENTTAILTGFGRSYENGYLSHTLKKTNIMVVDMKFCRDKFFDRADLSGNDHLCGYSPSGNGICKGDSGGPLLVDGVVFGISSLANRGCADKTYPTVFTKVSSYLDWINKHGNSTLCYAAAPGA